jgi:hypothetical protein
MTLLSGTAITNGTALDVFADVGLVLASAAFVAPNFIGVYLYPLGDDGSTYGDGRFGTAAAGRRHRIIMLARSDWSRPVAQTGQLLGIVLPPGSCKFVLYNQGSVNWAASGSPLKYRSYNRSMA